MHAGLTAQDLNATRDVERAVHSAAATGWTVRSVSINIKIKGWISCGSSELKQINKQHCGMKWNLNSN